MCLFYRNLNGSMLITLILEMVMNILMSKNQLIHMIVFLYFGLGSLIFYIGIEIFLKLKRGVPHFSSWWDRRHRLYDNFSLYVLPGTSVLAFQFWDINLGFKVNLI